MKDTLTLSEGEQEVPYFGKLVVFGMVCSSCGFKKSDIESFDPKDPCKCVIEIDSEEDMKIRVIKSSEAVVKIPRIITMEPGPASNGYVTNIEGLLVKAKNVIENQRDAEEDKDVKKKCKNMLKKLQKIMWGQEKITITIEDPTGNSAIISDKCKVSKLKV